MLAFARKTVLGLLILVAAVSGPRALEAADAPPLGGTWKVLIEDGRDYFLELRSEGEKVSGTFISPRTPGRNPIESGKYSGGKLRIEVPRRGEEATRVFVIEAEWKGERFEGTLHVNGEAAGSLTLTREKRPASIAGKWRVVSKTSEGQEYASVMDIEDAEGKLRGKASSDLGTFEIGDPIFDEGKLSFRITLPIQGNDTAFEVNAELKDEKTLEGRWKVRDADISGEWRAEREAAPEKAPESTKDTAETQGLEGEWFGVSTHPDGQKRGFRIILKRQGDTVVGMLHSDDREQALKEVKVQGTKLQFSIDVEGNVGKVEGELKDGVLAGKWSLGSEVGEWRSRKPASF